jgi:hypothetical protein
MQRISSTDNFVNNSNLIKNNAKIPKDKIYA